MKNFKIVFGIYAVLALCCGIGLSIVLSKALNNMSENKEEMKSHIGEQVIIDGDTSTVVDYNSLNGTYTLSNGVEVAKKLVDGD